jgi:S-(hydroxymethyl)glutathione dehydrogenase/alcohol dehydrogenase
MTESATTARAAIMTAANAPIEIANIDVLPPQEAEVLVEIKASGLCHSDYNSYIDSSTPVPCVLGHEGAGIVRDVGPGVTRVKPGDSVVLSWAPYCGKCRYCKAGRVVLCETMIAPMWNGTLFDGTTRFRLGQEVVYQYSCLSTFTEFTVVHQNCCIPLPDGMPLKQASLIGCGVATGYGAAVKAGEISSGQSVAVFGVGGVGNAAVQGARIAGAEVIVAIDINDSNEAAILELGATHFINPTREVVVERISEITEGYGVDVVIDATGAPAVGSQAFECVGKGGRLIIAGALPSEATLTIPTSGFHRMEKSVRGTFYGSIDPLEDLEQLCKMYLSGDLKLDQLLLESLTLDELPQRLQNFPNSHGSSSGRSVIGF